MQKKLKFNLADRDKHADELKLLFGKVLEKEILHATNEKNIACKGDIPNGVSRMQSILGICTTHSDAQRKHDEECE